MLSLSKRLTLIMQKLLYWTTAMSGVCGNILVRSVSHDELGLPGESNSRAVNGPANNPIIPPRWTGVITLWTGCGCRTAENEGERMYQLSSHTFERNVLWMLLKHLSEYPYQQHKPRGNISICISLQLNHSSALQGPCVKAAHDVLQISLKVLGFGGGVKIWAVV